MSSDGVISEIKKIWKCAISHDSVFVELMTALDPIVDFHKLLTPLTTATLSHVKKALDNCKVQKRIHTSNYVGVSVLLFVLRQQGDV